MKVKDLIKYLQDCDQDGEIIFDILDCKSEDKTADISEFGEYCNQGATPNTVVIVLE